MFSMWRLSWAWLGVLAYSTSAFAAPPTVFWASGPVGPDETVMLQGSDFGGASTVEFTRLNDDPNANTLSEHFVSAIAARDDSIKFTIPADWKMGVYECRVFSDVAKDIGSKSFLVNAPNPWWMQGDAGSAATPGG